MRTWYFYLLPSEDIALIKKIQPTGAILTVTCSRWLIAGRHLEKMGSYRIWCPYEWLGGMERWPLVLAIYVLFFRKQKFECAQNVNRCTRSLQNGESTTILSACRNTLFQFNYWLHFLVLD